MTDETDIYLAAHEYIKQYGDYAPIQVSMMGRQDDEEGKYGRPRYVTQDHHGYRGIADVKTV